MRHTATIPYAAALCLALALSSAVLQGQTASPAPATTPAADVQHSYAALKANILKAAENTPADAYTFRPTADIRTFGRVVNHITEAQLHSCGGLNHTAPDTLAKVPPETADKAAIVSALRASFAECDKAYASLNDNNLLQTITVGPATRARISFAWGNVSHDNEQYAALALYMRLRGIAPPSTEK